MNSDQLSRIVIKGYKSIVQCDLEMKDLNVLIGSNGAGKSNFISFFKLIQSILDEKLQLSVSRQGGPDALLHFGRKKTECLKAELYFGNNGYLFSLEATQDNRLMFLEERMWWNMKRDYGIESGHFESMMIKYQHSGIYKCTIPVMKTWRVYHFHDTSDTALVKQLHAANDCAYLRSDARNLAAYLFYLQQNYPKSYQKIEKVVGLVAPFFGQFYLTPSPFNADQIELMWYEKDEDVPFKAHQLSDGTLRFICLATVLLQPEDKQSECIMIDEPELGLHPYAITVLASLIKAVSKVKQVIISTQSVDLLSEFSAEDVIVVNRENHQSVFTRLDENQLETWLSDYSLGELWKKNILGGRPSR